MDGGRCSRRAVLSALGGVGAATLAGCSLVGGEGPAIAVPDAALRDEPVAVELTGFDPETTVTVRAETTDFRRTGRRWTSRATFETDADGRVDLTERAPVSGSYEGVDGMGLFWSMTPVEPGTRTSTGVDAATATATPSPTAAGGARTAVGGDRPGGYDVTVEATVDGDVRATATTTRRWAAEDVVRESVRTDAVVGELFRPGGDGPHPGVLVLHGSSGRPSVSLARALASRGFAAFAVQYFDPAGEADPIPGELVEVPLSYFDDARTWLTDRAEVRRGPVGVVGGSKGGEAALLVGATFDWPGAVVAYAPSCYAWSGLTVDRAAGALEFGPAAGSSWERDGEPVPHLRVLGRGTITEHGKYASRPAYRTGAEQASEERREAAFVPVEEIDAPLLLVSGGDDRLWQSASFGRRVVERLDDAGVGFAYDHRSYESAGHSINVPYVPTATAPLDTRLAMGGSPAGDARAEADSWPRVRETLNEGLA